MNSILSSLFILCLFSFLLKQQQVVDCAPYYETEFDYNDGPQGRRIAQGNVIFYRFDMDKYMAWSMAYFTLAVEACDGTIDVFYTSCSKVTDPTCDDGSLQWFPNNSQNFSAINYKSTMFGDYAQRPVIFEKVPAVASTYHYFGITPRKPSHSYDDRVSISISFFRFLANEKGMFYNYLNSLTVDGSNPKTNTVSFQAAKRCTSVDNQGKCVLSSELKGIISYSIYWILLEEAKSGKYNIGTDCGMRFISKTTDLVTPTTYNFSKYNNSVTYVVNIGYKTNQERTLHLAYEPMLWKKNKTDPVSPVPPNPVGPIPPHVIKSNRRLMAISIIVPVIVNSLLCFGGCFILLRLVKRGSKIGLDKHGVLTVSDYVKMENENEMVFPSNYQPERVPDEQQMGVPYPHMGSQPHLMGYVPPSYIPTQ